MGSVVLNEWLFNKKLLYMIIQQNQALKKTYTID